MKGEFLLEIGTEEIPAGFAVPAIESLRELFARAMETARVTHGRLETYGTPRRLILSAFDVAPMQTSREIEKTGPPKSSAFDENGNATKAAVGFAKSQGVEVSDLIVVQTSRGEQLAVRKVEEGIPTRSVLANLLPGLIERIPFPKTMRWMDQDVRYARPIHWMVALLDGEVVPFSFGNIQTGNQSRGHRFIAPSPFTVTSLESLRTTLEQQGVTIDATRRRSEIEDKIKALAEREGFKIFADPSLLDEVAFLVESPYPIMGRFPSDFLELPASILITCMKKHQRYFSVQDGNSRITNRFIAVNNTPVMDPQCP